MPYDLLRGFPVASPALTERGGNQGASVVTLQAGHQERAVNPLIRFPFPVIYSGGSYPGSSLLFVISLLYFLRHSRIVPHVWRRGPISWCVHSTDHQGGGPGFPFQGLGLLGAQETCAHSVFARTPAPDLLLGVIGFPECPLGVCVLLLDGQLFTTGTHMQRP